jgi:hypothetical protein
MSANEHRLHTLLGAHDAKFPQQTALRFPHVADRLADLWGTREIDGYFSELMVADERRKAGFPPEVALEILSLSMLHDSLFPGAATRLDAWVEAAQRDRADRTGRSPTPGPDKR